MQGCALFFGVSTFGPSVLDLAAFCHLYVTSSLVTLPSTVPMAFKLHACVIALPPVQLILTEHPSVPGTLLDFGETVVTVTSSLPSKGDIAV